MSPHRTFWGLDKQYRTYLTFSGSRVEAHLVPTVYAKGMTISDEQMATLNLQAHAVCPQWTYTLHPCVARTPSCHAAEVILL